MKLRSLCTLATLLLLPALLNGCDNDPTGPTDRIFTAQSVRINGQGAALPLPTVFFSGPVPCGSGVTCEIRYEVRRATLILRHDGRYEFNGEYRLSESNNRFPAESPGAFEDGTYRVQGEVVTFTPAASSNVFVQGTGTLQNNVLTVSILDPLIREPDTYAFTQ